MAAAFSRLGDVELTVNSINRRGGVPPSVSIEYKIDR
jgi:hypothetical protein